MPAPPAIPSLSNGLGYIYLYIYIFIYIYIYIYLYMEKMQVTGNRLPGRTKGTLEKLVQGDLKGKGLKEEQALDRKG